MKLVSFEHCQGYVFRLNFINGETGEVDLSELIGKYINLESINSARLDSDWGCLEFSGGMVDIEPKTLYQFAKTHGKLIN